MAGTYQRPFTCPVVVGRAEQLAVLDRCLAETRAGQGLTLLIAGEAGAGKSRLIAVAKARAAHLGLIALQGNCFEPDQVLPFAPIADLLRAVGPAEVLARRLGPAAAALRQLLPELVAHAPAAEPVALDADHERRRLFETTATLLTELAAEQPLLVVFEDIHWADDASLDLLLFLARRVAAAPMLLVLTYRAGEVQPGLRRLLAGLDRERLAAELTAAPLGATDVAAMVQATLGPAQPVRAGLIEAIQALTEGNPFFVEEVLKSLAADEALDAPAGPTGEPLKIPRTVQDAVQGRVERLSPGTRETLAWAAVAGRRFDFTLLQTVTRSDELDLLAQMKELLAAQLVVEESADRFAFRHALTRQAVYAGLLARERRALHRRIAEALADQAGVHPADLAYHAFAAEQWQTALTHARQAGDLALSMYAPRAAVEQYDRAVEAAGRLGRPLEPGLLRSRGQAHDLVGNYPAALADYEAALAAALAGDDRQAEWQALLDLGFLWAARDYTRTGDLFDRALRLARDLDDPAALAHSLNRVGNWYVNIEQPRVGLAHHQEALAIFEGLDDRRGVAATLDLLALTYGELGDMSGSVAVHQRAFALYDQLGDRFGPAFGLSLVAMSGPGLMCLTQVPATGPFVTAARENELGLRRAREVGWRSGEAFALITLAHVRAFQGAYEPTLALARAGLALAEEIDHRQWACGGHMALGVILLDLLAVPAALDHLERALALAHEVSSLIWLRLVSGSLALAAILQGETARAAAVLAGAITPTTPMETVAQRTCWYAQADLALAQGEPAQALVVADRLLATASGIETAGERAIPHLAWLRGKALATLGRSAEAEAALLTARAGAIDQGYVSFGWRVDLALGRLYQSLRRSDEAEAAFAAVRATADRLAATVDDPVLCETFSQGVANLLPRPRALTPLRAAKQAAGGLTAREREVVALIARGQSNREIAESLFVGEATIATHVSNIFGKLDLSSRAQIAAWAVERGLAHADDRDRT